MTYCQSAAYEPTLSECIQMIRAEYLEMPGLQLTAVQARRLWGLDESMSATALDVLVDSRFLRQTRKGAYVRVDAPW